MKLKLVLDNIRSTYNVGAILRTAEGFGVDAVIYAGVTPRFEDDSLLPHLRDKLNRQIAKTALGAEKMVKQEFVPDLLGFLVGEKKNGALIVGLENNLSLEEAQRRKFLGEELPECEEMIIILGEEVSGIPQAVREKVEIFLEIPMKGKKESFNVAVAAGVGMWGIVSQNKAADK